MDVVRPGERDFMVDIAWALADIKSRLDDYTHYRNYYDGEQKLNFATDKFLNAFGSTFQEFTTNVCGTVVDVFTDRIAITGWDAGDDAARALINDIWKNNRMRARSKAVHRCTFREGDGFVIIGKSPVTDQIRIYHQDPMQMAVRYTEDEPDDLECAAKIWHESIGENQWVCRGNLYYPNGIIRLVTKARGNCMLPESAKDFDIYESPESKPVDEWQYGMVPVVHFPNGDPGYYGRSDLVPIVPVQDALNKSICDMLVTSEFHAFPQRWATGIERKIDPITREEISPFIPGTDRLWTTAAADANFGSFAPTAMDGMLAVIQEHRADAARLSGVPDYLFGLNGNNIPSGVALTVVDGRLVAKAEDAHDTLGPQWEQVARLCLMMAGAGEIMDVPEPVWKRPGTDDPVSAIEIAAGKQALGVPWRQIMRELDYTEEQIAEMEAEKDEVEAQNARDAQALLDTFPSDQNALAMNGLPSPGGGNA